MSSIVEDILETEVNSYGFLSFLLMRIGQIGHRKQNSYISLEGLGGVLELDGILVSNLNCHTGDAVELNCRLRNQAKDINRF